MIAFHFPPSAGSSGIQRTLRMMQHLPAFGWEPLILTASAFAYERTSEDLLAEVPASVVVRRAMALDAARHLALRGRSLSALARPDRWTSWRFDAIRVGKQMVQQWRPAAIWSTYPIATAHVIGHALQRHSGLPWVADFRDPMAQEGYPPDPVTWQQFRQIEQMVFDAASFAVFTTPGAARTYRARYAARANDVCVIENGYDEESFASGPPAPGPAPVDARPVVLLHSGIVYASERDPTALFAAIAQMRAAGEVTPADLRIRFRAAVSEELLDELAARHGVRDFIEIGAAIGYREALAEMLSADARLVLQASNCNEQIPAKVYEYLRAGRPIVGLTDPVGDTAGVLRHAGVPYIAPLDSPAEIVRVLRTVLRALRAGNFHVPAAQAVRGATRKQRAGELARLLELATATASARVQET
jgi:glycosyltransferase involved in cell wall biosynthesis